MRNVLDESLRLYPPVPRDQRDAVKDDTLPSGFHIHMSNSLQRPQFGLLFRGPETLLMSFSFLLFLQSKF